MLDVLDAQVDALLNVAAAHLLVDDHADRVGRHVVHTASFAVVALVRHTLVDSTIALENKKVSEVRGCSLVVATYSLVTDVSCDNVHGHCSHPSQVSSFFFLKA